MNDKYALSLVRQASDALSVAAISLNGKHDELSPQQRDELRREIEMIRLQLQHLESAEGSVDFYCSDPVALAA